MSENEKVDFKKFAIGFAKPVEYWKAASITVKIGIFLIIGYMAYMTFFKKDVKQTQQIVAEEGSTINVTQVTERKRFIIPFVEVGVEKNSNTSLDTYIRAGGRIEF